MGFRDELANRGWLLKPGRQTPATHLLLDGGRIAVPDDHAGTFLNLYTNAHLRKERLCAVELKTAHFRMFFDVDAQILAQHDPGSATEAFMDIFSKINDLASIFWCLPCSPRLIVCAAPPKLMDAETKLGFHLHWPDVVVNAPIALAFREAVLDALDATASTSDSLHYIVNPWRDVIDTSVFKANGLRMIFSEKKDIPRPYAPISILGVGGIAQPVSELTAKDRRQFVMDTSIRAFGEDLTPCASGIHQLADDVKYGQVKHGCSVHLDVYADVLARVQAALPEIYSTQHFTGVFKLDNAVMLRSSSRYCQNLQREHRTSNIYFVISRRGVAQRCYCRKDDRGCTEFCSEWYGLPLDVIDAFLPPVSLDREELLKEEILKMPSRKRTSGDLHALLSRSRPLSSPAGGTAAKRKRSSKKSRT